MPGKQATAGIVDRRNICSWGSQKDDGTFLYQWTKRHSIEALCDNHHSQKHTGNPIGRECCDAYGLKCISGFKLLWCYP